MPCELSLRLVPDVSAEAEWFYLVNETYIGEVCIIPLLEDLLDAPVDTPAFHRMIGRQIDEEWEHARRYRELLGDRPLPGSGYDRPFSAYVRELPSVTLKLFALQALLEGISLGALRYRSEVITRAPSQGIDQSFIEDEVRHTKFAHGYLKHLVRLDGVVPVAEFRRVAHEVNAMFAQHFNAGAVLDVLGQLGVTSHLAPVSIQSSPGMKRLSRMSARSIVDVKADFLSRYGVACHAA
jgi:hypothetical protein